MSVTVHTAKGAPFTVHRSEQPWHTGPHAHLLCRNAPHVWHAAQRQPAVANHLGDARRDLRRALVIERPRGPDVVKADKRLDACRGGYQAGGRGGKEFGGRDLCRALGVERPRGPDVVEADERLDARHRG
eukprot:362871-Chlamydomonas_euryale.AAC.2